MTPPADWLNGHPPLGKYARQIRFNRPTIVNERSEAEKAADREAYRKMCQGHPHYAGPAIRGGR